VLQNVLALKVMLFIMLSEKSEADKLEVSFSHTLNFHVEKFIFFGFIWSIVRFKKLHTSKNKLDGSGLQNFLK